jgi:hypothetical protein
MDKGIKSSDAKTSSQAPKNPTVTTGIDTTHLLGRPVTSRHGDHFQESGVIVDIVPCGSRSKVVVRFENNETEELFLKDIWIPGSESEGTGSSEDEEEQDDSSDDDSKIDEDSEEVFDAKLKSKGDPITQNAGTHSAPGNNRISAPVVNGKEKGKKRKKEPVEEAATEEPKKKKKKEPTKEELLKPHGQQWVIIDDPRSIIEDPEVLRVRKRHSTQIHFDRFEIDVPPPQDRLNRPRLYFKGSYPWKTVGETVEATRKNMDSDRERAAHTQKHFYEFTRGRFFTFIGITIVMALYPMRGGLDAYWRESDDLTRMKKGGRFGSQFGMSLEEFKNIRQYFQLKKYDTADLLLVNYVCMFYSIDFSSLCICSF